MLSNGRFAVDGQNSIAVGRLLHHVVQVVDGVPSRQWGGLGIRHLSAVQFQRLLLEVVQLQESLVVILGVGCRNARSQLTSLVVDDALKVQDELVQKVVCILVDFVLDTEWFGGVLVRLLSLGMRLLGVEWIGQGSLEDGGGGVVSKA